MATSTIFNFNFNNSEIVDSTGQWYNATTGTPTTEFIEHDGNTALFQPALTGGDRITPNPTMLRSYDPNFKAYTYTLEVQVCAVLNRTSNSSLILNFPINEDGFASALGLFYNQNDTLEMWIDYVSEGYIIHPVLIDFNTAGFDRWFSVRIERTVDPNNPYIGATVKAYVDGTEVYNQTFTYAQSTIRGMIGPRLQYCENLYATGGIAIDNLKLTAGIAPSSVVDVSLANLQRNNANLLSFIKGKVPTVNDGTLTIKVNGATAGTFTANQSTAATANITVPTAVSELTNDSGYLTSSSNLDASKLTSGTVDIERLPQGALERLVKVANEAARYALTTADVQLGDTVQQLDTGIMYVVTDTDHLDSAAGYTEYTAGTAASVPWSGVTGKPAFATVATSGSYNDLSNKPTISYDSNTETLTVTY
jgi:hypothetical protein